MPGWWNRQSTVVKVLIVVGAVIVIGAIARGGSASNSNKSVATTTTTVSSTITTKAEAGSSGTSPEWLLASIDTHNPALPLDDVTVRYFARYLDSLEAKTTNSRMNIADVVAKAWEILQEKGYDDSLKWVIEQLDYCIPEGSPRMELEGVAASWMVLRMQ